GFSFRKRIRYSSFCTCDTGHPGGLCGAEQRNGAGKQQAPVTVVVSVRLQNSGFNSTAARNRVPVECQSACRIGDACCLCFGRTAVKEKVLAYIQSARKKRPDGAAVQDRKPGSAGLPAAARRLHPRIHANPKEAELRPAQGRPRPPDEWH